jgi:hypothetical protein
MFHAQTHPVLRLCTKVTVPVHVSLQGQRTPRTFRALQSMGCYVRYDHFTRIRHLKFEPAHKHGRKTSELCGSKSVPDTASRSMKEGEIGIVAFRTSGIVRSLYASLWIFVDPSLRAKFQCVRSPELFVAVGGQR